MKSKYIKFVKIADKPKTTVWSCRNISGDYELGQIRWYPQWRQYCFFPVENTVYSMGCMEDINQFIVELRK
jgi:hypothetical protein